MSRPVLDRAGEQAIDWMVRLRADEPDAVLHARFERWLHSDVANGQAWARLQERLGGPYSSLRELDRRLPGQAGEARELLLRPTVARRELLRAFSGIALLGGGLWLGARSQSGQALLADLRTATGERRLFSLDDGSQLHLNASSAVDITFDSRQRLLTLHRGELVVQVAPDATRPFIVRTTQGDVRALGTRFLVRQEAEATRVVVLEHAVRTSLRNGHSLDLAEGQAALLHARHIETLADDQRRRADWLQGRLSVLDEPLDSVIDALRSYRSGLLRVAPGVRDLRVQGVYPLDDSDRTLTALAETLPITVTRYGPWLTLIDAR